MSTILKKASKCLTCNKMLSAGTKAFLSKDGRVVFCTAQHQSSREQKPAEILIQKAGIPMIENKTIYQKQTNVDAPQIKEPLENYTPSQQEAFLRRTKRWFEYRPPGNNKKETLADSQRLKFISKTWETMVMSPSHQKTLIEFLYKHYKALTDAYKKIKSERKVRTLPGTVKGAVARDDKISKTEEMIDDLYKIDNYDSDKASEFVAKISDAIESLLRASTYLLASRPGEREEFLKEWQQQVRGASTTHDESILAIKDHSRMPNISEYQAPIGLLLRERNPKKTANEKVRFLVLDNVRFYYQLLYAWVKRVAVRYNLETSIEIYLRNACLDEPQSLIAIELFRKSLDPHQMISSITYSPQNTDVKRSLNYQSTGSGKTVILSRFLGNSFDPLYWVIPPKITRKNHDASKYPRLILVTKAKLTDVSNAGKDLWAFLWKRPDILEAYARLRGVEKEEIDMPRLYRDLAAFNLIILSYKQFLNIWITDIYDDSMKKTRISRKKHLYCPKASESVLEQIFGYANGDYLWKKFQAPYGIHRKPNEKNPSKIDSLGWRRLQWSPDNDQNILGGFLKNAKIVVDEAHNIFNPDQIESAFDREIFEDIAVRYPELEMSFFTATPFFQNTQNLAKLTMMITTDFFFRQEPEIYTELAIKPLDRQSMERLLSQSDLKTYPRALRTLKVVDLETYGNKKILQNIIQQQKPQSPQTAIDIVQLVSNKAQNVLLGRISYVNAYENLDKFPDLVESIVRTNLPLRNIPLIERLLTQSKTPRDFLQLGDSGDDIVLILGRALANEKKQSAEEESIGGVVDEDTQEEYEEFQQAKRKTKQADKFEEIIRRRSSTRERRERKTYQEELEETETTRKKQRLMEGMQELVAPLTTGGEKPKKVRRKRGEEEESEDEEEEEEQNEDEEEEKKNPKTEILVKNRIFEQLSLFGLVDHKFSDNSYKRASAFSSKYNVKEWKPNTLCIHSPSFENLFQMIRDKDMADLKLYGRLFKHAIYVRTTETLELLEGFMIAQGFAHVSFQVSDEDESLSSLVMRKSPARISDITQLNPHDKPILPLSHQEVDKMIDRRENLTQIQYEGATVPVLGHSIFHEGRVLPSFMKLPAFMILSGNDHVDQNCAHWQGSQEELPSMIEKRKAYEDGIVISPFRFAKFYEMRRAIKGYHCKGLLSYLQTTMKTVQIETVKHMQQAFLSFDDEMDDTPSLLELQRVEVLADESFSFTVADEQESIFGKVSRKYESSNTHPNVTQRQKVLSHILQEYTKEDSDFMYVATVFLLYLNTLFGNHTQLIKSFFHAIYLWRLYLLVDVNIVNANSSLKKESDFNEIFLTLEKAKQPFSISTLSVHSIFQEDFKSLLGPTLSERLKDYEERWRSKSQSVLMIAGGNDEKINQLLPLMIHNLRKFYIPMLSKEVQQQQQKSTTLFDSASSSSSSFFKEIYEENIEFIEEGDDDYDSEDDDHDQIEHEKDEQRDLVKLASPRYKPASKESKLKNKKPEQARIVVTYHSKPANEEQRKTRRQTRVNEDTLEKTQVDRVAQEILDSKPSLQEFLRKIQGKPILIDRQELLAFNRETLSQWKPRIYTREFSTTAGERKLVIAEIQAREFGLENDPNMASQGLFKTLLDMNVISYDVRYKKPEEMSASVKNVFNGTIPDDQPELFDKLNKVTKFHNQQESPTVVEQITSRRTTRGAEKQLNEAQILEGLKMETYTEKIGMLLRPDRDFVVRESSEEEEESSPTLIRADIRMILFDSNYDEGVDIPGIRYLHIVQAPKTNDQKTQIIGRGGRRCGHKFEPRVDGKWQVHILHTDIQNDVHMPEWTQDPPFSIDTRELSLFMRSERFHQMLDAKRINIQELYPSVKLLQTPVIATTPSSDSSGGDIDKEAQTLRQEQDTKQALDLERKINEQIASKYGDLVAYSKLVKSIYISFADEDKRIEIDELLKKCSIERNLTKALARDSLKFFLTGLCLTLPFETKQSIAYVAAFYEVLFKFVAEAGFLNSKIIESLPQLKESIIANRHRPYSSLEAFRIYRNGPSALESIYPGEYFVGFFVSTDADEIKMHPLPHQAGIVRLEPNDTQLSSFFYLSLNQFLRGIFSLVNYPSLESSYDIIKHLDKPREVTKWINIYEEMWFDKLITNGETDFQLAPDENFIMLERYRIRRVLLLLKSFFVDLEGISVVENTLLEKRLGKVLLAMDDIDKNPKQSIIDLIFEEGFEGNKKKTETYISNVMSSLYPQFFSNHIFNRENLFTIVYALCGADYSLAVQYSHRLFLILEILLEKDPSLCSKHLNGTLNYYVDKEESDLKWLYIYDYRENALFASMETLEAFFIIQACSQLPSSGEFAVRFLMIYRMIYVLGVGDKVDLLRNITKNLRKDDNKLLLTKKRHFVKSDIDLVVRIIQHHLDTEKVSAHVQMKAARFNQFINESKQFAVTLFLKHNKSDENLKQLSTLLKSIVSTLSQALISESEQDQMMASFEEWFDRKLFRYFLESYVPASFIKDSMYDTAKERQVTSVAVMLDLLFTDPKERSQITYLTLVGPSSSTNVSEESLRNLRLIGFQVNQEDDDEEMEVIQFALGPDSKQMQIVSNASAEIIRIEPLKIEPLKARLDIANDEKVLEWKMFRLWLEGRGRWTDLDKYPFDYYEKSKIRFCSILFRTILPPSDNYIPKLEPSLAQSKQLQPDFFKRLVTIYGSIDKIKEITQKLYTLFLEKETVYGFTTFVDVCLVFLLNKIDHFEKAETVLKWLRTYWFERPDPLPLSSSLVMKQPVNKTLRHYFYWNMYPFSFGVINDVYDVILALNEIFAGDPSDDVVKENEMEYISDNPNIREQLFVGASEDEIGNFKKDLQPSTKTKYAGDRWKAIRRAFKNILPLEEDKPTSLEKLNLIARKFRNLLKVARSEIIKKPPTKPQEKVVVEVTNNNNNNVVVLEKDSHEKELTRRQKMNSAVDEFIVIRNFSTPNPPSVFFSNLK